MNNVNDVQQINTTLTIAIAISAIISPILVAIINNLYSCYMKKLEKTSNNLAKRHDEQIHIYENDLKNNIFH